MPIKKYKIKSASEYVYPSENDLPEKLLSGKINFRRGGAGLWTGLTGQGTSQSLISACTKWWRGQSWQGLKPSKPLKILTITGDRTFAQYTRGENPFVIAKGFVIAPVGSWVKGREFVHEVEKLCLIYKPDILVIDPLYLYLHGSMDDARCNCEFIAWLDAMRIREQIGIIVVQPTGASCPLGWGCSMWANWPRWITHVTSHAGKINIIKGRCK